VNTDQNLLFGVLALELEYIDIRQFAEVCCTWAAHKETELADLLVERHWIGAEERDEVQRLMDRKLLRKQGDVRQTLSDVAGPQLRDVMHGVGDRQVEQTLSQLEPVPGFVRVSETAQLAQGEISHYTLSRVHDQGGLGRVWLAFDKRLCRDVALKEIRPDRLPTDQSLRRFVREAQITGQLEHPNIVPVYELARDEERTYPFYTMRFVHGQSLGDAIEAYHQQRRVGADVRIEFRRLLQAFVSVCQAIAYAHSRRVIHRDLKPSNVMLGSYGEVVVLDWGLAKILDKQDEATEAEPAIRNLDDSGGVATQPGQVLGTPAYMAPEQALSKHDEIDALTDVYGLGAILYRLLTGERPHRGRDSQERIRHAAEDPTPEPRSVAASVPRPLSAICRKAMSRNRLDRYLSAGALAEDVQRWLADEPVSTYRDPWYVRVGRWTRRHRQLTAAVAAVVLLTAVTATTAAVLIDHARHAALEARQREAQARRVAFGWFREAQRTIDVMATGVSKVLENLPGTDGLRLRLLHEAASSYERFADQDSPDPQVQLERGHTLVRLGDVRRRMRKYPEAVAAYAAAEQVYCGLLAAPPSNRDVRLDAAECLRKRGDALLDQDDRETARRALTEAQHHLAHAQESAERRRQEIEWKISLGLLEQACGNEPQAEHWYRQALAQAAQPKPDDADSLEQLALVQSLVGETLSRAGRHAEAIEALRGSLDTHRRRANLETDRESCKESLAFAELGLAQALLPLGQCNEQADVLTNAVRHYDELLQSVGILPHLRQNRVIAIAHLGQLHHSARRNRDACRLLDDAVAEFERLAESPGAGLDELDLLARVYTLRGRVLRDLALLDAAENDFRNALRIFVEDLIPADSAGGDYQRGVATCGRHYAVLLERTGQRQEAEDELATAQRLLATALEHDPQNRFSRDEMAFCQEYRGDFQRRNQAAELAREAYRQALAVRQQLPEEPELLARRIRVLLKLGEAADLQQAATDVDKLVGLCPQNAAYQTLKAHVDYCRHDVDACLATLSALAEDDLTSPGPERLFLLAMALHERKQSDDAQRARESFEQASKQMQAEAPGDVPLIELCEQAAAKLGISVAAKPKPALPKDTQPAERKAAAARSSDPARSGP